MTAKVDAIIEEFGVSPSLADALVRAHASEYGHLEDETQNQAYRCIRKLLAFFLSQSILALPIPSSTARDFHNWLKSVKLQDSTRQSHQLIVLNVLRWCARNVQGFIAAGANFNVPAFKREAPKEKVKHDEQTTKMVLAACYREIAQIEERVHKGVSKLSAADKKTVEDLLRIGKGKIPSQVVVNKSKESLAARSQALGGLRAIRELLWITIKDLLPFYLVVLIQAAGNPGAVIKAGRNCISKHPIRDDIEYLTFVKARAAKEQRIDFPVKQASSAPNIIRRLLRLNEKMHRDAAPSQKNALFLAGSVQGNKPTVPSTQSLHNYLEEFIVRNGLPNFDFEDWRATSASAHRQFTGSVEPARARLNHASSATTARYTGPEDVKDRYEKAILKFQGVFIQKSKGLVETDIDESGGDFVTKIAKTVFGFLCKNPFEGLDGVTSVGTRCVNFTRCATCPGSLIPLDDPKVIAVILGAEIALNDAKQRASREGWVPRFENLYGNTLAIVNQEILPSVHKRILEVARTLIKPHYIPFLE